MRAFFTSMYNQAKSYHYLYDTARWKRIRLQHLELNPLCVYCLEQDIITEATICDHRKPHKGNEYMFFDTTNLQSLCKRCHDSDKKQLEVTGKRKPVTGVDGWPIN